MAAEALKEIPQDQLKDYERLFTLFDIGSSGSVTSEEMKTLVRANGACPTERQLDEDFQFLQEQGEGGVSRGVSREAMILYLYTHQNEVAISAHAHEQELSRAFARFDKNQDGRIFLSDLRDALLTLGEPLTAKEVAEMLAHAKADEKGRINYREFASILAGGLL